MSLRTSIPDFQDTIVKLESGKKILNGYIKPLLAESNNYYKISSFFSPSIIKSILFELNTCFQRRGSVKLIIGIHDSAKLIPVLDQIQNANKHDKFKIAVQKIISKNIEECLELLEHPKNFMYVFAEIIKQELIQIKIASVKKDFMNYATTGKWPENDSTFHPKVSIFKDIDDTVVMSGSINSTNKGFGDNVEEASFIGSWFSQKSVSFYEDVFKEIWEGCHSDSQTIDFNNEIREIVNEIMKSSKVFKRESSEYFSNLTLNYLINNSPFFFHHSFDKVRLLPHQWLVYNLLLSRWPIVGLIADEVGLGKTIEAGAIIKYVKHFCSINRIVLLVPSSLRNQWQREMYNLFGLEFYIYDSNSKSLIFAPNNDIVDVISNVGPDNYFSHGVENIVFSWHFLRGNQDNGFKLSAEDKIDMVVVDEAHGARISQDLSGGQGSTLLYQFLQSLLPSVPHKLLLTATPFQTSTLDYLALLRLLMSSENIDQNSLERIAFINLNQPLANQQRIDAMIEIINEMPYNIKGIPTEIDITDFPTLFDLYNDNLYTQNHPTTIYTLRNTRDRLREIGYQFPLVHLHSKSIELEKKQKRIFQLASNYIENDLFVFESTLGVRGIGFVKTIYHQRIVSSYKACYDTLKNRFSKLSTYVEKGFIGGDIVGLEGDDDAEIGLRFIENRPLTQSEISIAQTELDFIREVLTKMEIKLIRNDEISDPKIAKSLSIIEEHLAQGDKIIVFSRFTSTTDFIVQKIMTLNEYPIGRYQGNLKQIIKNEIIADVDRQTISDKFNNDEFPVIICSDAASEGLNLQTANVVINVDVPWNPARLLQRFGRIDRFGQKKENIYFYNLFYPDTVEDRMYTRLHQRNTEFREILGATPDITSPDHIRDLQFREVLNPDNSQPFSYKNSLISLTSRDNIRIHDHILERLDTLEGLSRDDKTLNYFGQSFNYSTNELDSDYLDLNHDILNELDGKYNGNFVPVYELRNGKEELFFYCVKNENRVYPILSIEEILDYLILGKTLEIKREREHLSYDSLEAGLFSLLNNPTYKLINHNLIGFNNIRNDFYHSLAINPTSVQISCIFYNN